MATPKGFRERTKANEVYHLEDGIIYYNYLGKKIFSREVCPEIIDILIKTRTEDEIKLLKNGKRIRFRTMIYENELKSINSYILGWDKQFVLQPEYKEPIVRAVGDVELDRKSIRCWMKSKMEDVWAEVVPTVLKAVSQCQEEYKQILRDYDHDPTTGAELYHSLIVNTIVDNLAEEMDKKQPTKKQSKKSK